MQAKILHVKHGWDVSILYSHKHARGDTVQGYGTPGIGAKFIGKERDNVSEAYVGYEDEFVAPCSSFIISLVLFFSLNWNRLQ